MAEFKTWDSFHKFDWEVRTVSRYVRSKDTEDFLSAVRETCKRRVANVKTGRTLWRAQLGHDWRYEKQNGEDFPNPYPPKRMIPLKDRAMEGRANPKGIPYLYLASNRKAAMSETRPGIGSYVSLGYFKIARDLRVVNCSKYDNKNFLCYLEEPPAAERETSVWHHINGAFAEPVTRSDDTSGYVSTQILAELFRSEGYDGVAYKSLFVDGAINFAFFGLDVATLHSCHLYKTDGADFSFKEDANPYSTGPVKPKKRRK